MLDSLTNVFPTFGKDLKAKNKKKLQIKQNYVKGPKTMCKQAIHSVNITNEQDGLFANTSYFISGEKERILIQ